MKREELARLAGVDPKAVDHWEKGEGAQGEVSAQQLSDAMSATLSAAGVAAAGNSSANTNAIPTLATPFADPDAEALRVRMNELIGGLRR